MRWMRSVISYIGTRMGMGSSSTPVDTKPKPEAVLSVDTLRKGIEAVRLQRSWPHPIEYHHPQCKLVTSVGEEECNCNVFYSR